VVIILSRYKYGKKSINRECAKAISDADYKCFKRAVQKNQNLDTIADEVACLRERLDVINDLLEEISELSTSVREELGEIENSVTVLEELV